MIPIEFSKIFAWLTIATIAMFVLKSTVYAANDGTVLTVNTALNVEPVAESYEYPPEEYSQEIAWVWYPISVINEPMNGFNAIRRTYALPPDVNPAVIATEDFEMFGQTFSFAYVLQQATSDESFKEIRETVTIEARSRNLNDILPNLEQEIWYDRDGFAGTLSLDIHSISGEVEGTTRHTSTATRQRTFPHLSTPDNSLIPRTITEGGTTFTLSSVDWQSASVSAIDGHPVASSYTAHATFTAQVTQTRTIGYTITADYVGMVFRTTQGKTLFTAIFYGEPIIEIWIDEQEPTHYENIFADYEEETALAPVPANEPREGAGNAMRIALGVIGAIVGLGAIGAGAFFLAKKFLGNNVTVYSIDGPREIVKAGKIKLDANVPEPTINLGNISKPAKTGRYIIQIAQKAIPPLLNKTVRVVLFDKEAFHEISAPAADVPVYEFEVNFSDDDWDETADSGFSGGGDAT